MCSAQLYTIEKKISGQIKEKGSKFIGYIYPFEKETQLEEILTHLKKEHKTARHYCLAYRIGYSDTYERFKDDGEPSGTAGKPILNMIQKYCLSNVLIVVVRYFGGTLLGTGGLAKAYKDAAEEAINYSELIELHELVEAKFLCEPDEMNTLMNLLKDHDALIKKQDFESKYILEVSLKIHDYLKLVEKVESFYETTIEMIKLTP